MMGEKKKGVRKQHTIVRASQSWRLTRLYVGN